MTFDKIFRVGYITKAQGVRGEVRVQVLGGDSARLLSQRHLYLENRNKQLQCIAVRFARATNEGIIISLEGVDDRSAAEMLRGLYLCLPREELLPLPEGQNYIEDLIGCEIFDQNEKSYGKLQDVLQNGAADVYVIAGSDGNEWMVPALKRLIVDVDIQAATIHIDATAWDEVAVLQN